MSLNDPCEIGLTGSGRRVSPGRVRGRTLAGTGDSQSDVTMTGTQASAWMFALRRKGSPGERTRHAGRGMVHHVRGEHRRSHVLVAEQASECASVRAPLVVSSSGVEHRDLAALEVDIHGPQRQASEQPEVVPPDGWCQVPITLLEESHDEVSTPVSEPLSEWCRFLDAGPHGGWARGDVPIMLRTL